MHSLFPNDPPHFLEYSQEVMDAVRAQTIQKLPKGTLVTLTYNMQPLDLAAEAATGEPCPTTFFPGHAALILEHGGIFFDDGACLLILPLHENRIYEVGRDWVEPRLLLTHQPPAEAPIFCNHCLDGAHECFCMYAESDDSLLA